MSGPIITARTELGLSVGIFLPCYSRINFWFVKTYYRPFNLSSPFCSWPYFVHCVLQNSVTPLSSRAHSSTIESRLSDIPFYPTCRVETLHFINSHSEGLNSIETALAYVEQQREATATDVLLYRRWRDLVAKQSKEAQKHIQLLIS
jgi:hypothetical protein